MILIQHITKLSKIKKERRLDDIENQQKQYDNFYEWQVGGIRFRRKSRKYIK